MSTATGEPRRPPGERPATRPPLVKLVLGAGLLAIALAALIVMLRSAPRVAATNLVSDAQWAITLHPGEVLCDPGEIVPAGTGALRLRALAEAGRGPALSVSVAGPPGTRLAATEATGGLAAGWRTGSIRIPLRDTVGNTLGGGTVCVRNVGASTVSLGGAAPDGASVVTVDGHYLDGKPRVEYLGPGSQSWFALLPELARRFSLGKGRIVRHWASLAAIALVLCAIALAARTLLREAAP